MSIKKLIGETITTIEGMEKGSDCIVFKCSSGKQFKMYHEQDCCENVSLEDFDCEPLSLLGRIVLDAYESQSGDEPPPLEDSDVSYTWTFYRIWTNKGAVCLRWFGTSNGYYSERVDFEEIKA